MLHFDLSDRPKRRATTQKFMSELTPGGKAYIHDHTDYRTSFAVWIAQQRMRLGMKFTYKKLGDDVYEISITELAPEPPQPRSLK